MINTEFARCRMVEQQIRAWEVYDPQVLGVIKDLPRERFVPGAFAHLAYADTEIPLGHGQSMLKPIVDGRILQALNIGRKDSVLEVGTGSGFLTACLAKMAASVYSVDLYQDFIDRASSIFIDMGLGNITTEQLDVMQDLPEQLNGQFDAIAVTGSIPRPDNRFLEALKPGGRLFVVIGSSPAMSAELVTRGDGSQWQSKSLFETDIRPLENVEPISAFSF